MNRRRSADVRADHHGRRSDRGTDPAADARAQYGRDGRTYAWTYAWAETGTDVRTDASSDDARADTVDSRQHHADGRPVI